MVEEIQRARFEEALRGGGIAYYTNSKGERIVITKAEDIPSEAELSQGNPAKMAQAKQAIKAKMLKLQAEAELIGGFDEETPEAPEAPKAEAPKAPAKKSEDK